MRKSMGLKKNLSKEDHNQNANEKSLAFLLVNLELFVDGSNSITTTFFATAGDQDVVEVMFF